MFPGAKEIKSKTVRGRREREGEREREKRNVTWFSCCLDTREKQGMVISSHFKGI